jgi:hypothetical protein
MASKKSKKSAKPKKSPAQAHYLEVYFPDPKMKDLVFRAAKKAGVSASRLVTEAVAAKLGVELGQ